MSARAFAAALALALATPAAHAQFDLFEWTFSPGGILSAGTINTDNQMFITGGPLDPVGQFLGFTAVAPVAGTVRATFTYTTWDGFCDASVPVTNVNHVISQLASCSESGSVEFDVVAGSVFGFGLYTLVSTWPGYLILDDFDFEPDPPVTPWADLGNALAGSAGAPMLAGTGLLHPLYPVHVELSSALPGSLATLVVGLTAVNQPFAGGVLVPAPDVLVFGLPTGTGELKLSGTWPAHIPAGVTFSMQMWIADPAGPQGWAASNGLGATSQ